jgi:protein TonB
MFDDVLIESAGKDKKKGGWITAVISGVIHFTLIGAVIAAGMYVKENPDVIEKPMAAFIVTSAPPPPPPPPPPPASSNASQPHPQHVETPVEQKQPEFRQPTEVPQDVPDVPDTPVDDTEGSSEGGVVGGVKGGVIGGTVGGQIGGQIGGVLGGPLGGQVGGTGDSPVRVGGNVKAPVIVKRIEPLYNEVARKAKIQGFVIIEAVIDRNGDVTEARIIKPLPLGLDMAALNAVKQWKFKPGTLNGQPVPVYYNLTVNFRIE